MMTAQFCYKSCRHHWLNILYVLCVISAECRPAFTDHYTTSCLLLWDFWVLVQVIFQDAVSLLTLAVYCALLMTNNTGTFTLMQKMEQLRKLKIKPLRDRFTPVKILHRWATRVPWKVPTGLLCTTTDSYTVPKSKWYNHITPVLASFHCFQNLNRCSMCLHIQYVQYVLSIYFVF